MKKKNKRGIVPRFLKLRSLEKMSYLTQGSLKIKNESKKLTVEEWRRRVD